MFMLKARTKIPMAEMYSLKTSQYFAVNKHVNCHEVIEESRKSKSKYLHMVLGQKKPSIHPSIHPFFLPSFRPWKLPREWQFFHFYAHNYRGLNLVEIWFCLDPFLPWSSHLHCPLMCRYGTVHVCGTSIYRPVVKQKTNRFYTIIITSWPYEKSMGLL